MARPAEQQPTRAELEVLQVLWQRAPATVREVMQTLSRPRPRAYTSVMSLMNVMAEKGLLTRKAKGRAFVYRPAAPREKTLAGMVADLLGRAFDGSASEMVAHLLERTKPSRAELDEIREAIAAFRKKRKKRGG